MSFGGGGGRSGGGGGGRGGARRPAAGRAAARAGRAARTRGKRYFFRRRKVCKFCADKIDYVDYKDVKLLSGVRARAGQDPAAADVRHLRRAPAQADPGHQAGARTSRSCRSRRTSRRRAAASGAPSGLGAMQSPTPAPDASANGRSPAPGVLGAALSPRCSTAIAAHAAAAGAAPRSSRPFPLLVRAAARPACRRRLRARAFAAALLGSALHARRTALVLPAAGRPRAAHRRGDGARPRHRARLRLGLRRARRPGRR